MKTIDRKELIYTLMNEHQVFVKQIASLTLHQLNRAAFIHSHSASQFMAHTICLYKYSCNQLQKKFKWRRWILSILGFGKMPARPTCYTIDQWTSMQCKPTSNYFDESIFIAFEDEFRLLAEALWKQDEGVWNSQTIAHPVFGPLTIHDYIKGLIAYLKDANRVLKVNSIFAL